MTRGDAPRHTWRISIEPRGPFSLAAAREFWEGFTPAAYEARSDGNRFDFAILADDGLNPAAVRLIQRDNVIESELTSNAEPAAVEAQVRRMLSLDTDGTAFPAVGKRDPVVGRLQARYPGLRPVCFASPYEAAAWAIICNRIRIVQAAAIKRRLSDAFGPKIDINGQPESVFPSPDSLRQVDAFPGLSQRKITYLHALADATLDGALDFGELRAMPVEVARQQLKQLPGIGDFGADLILIRGTGGTDLLPIAEARLGRAVARAYDLPDVPDFTAIQAIAKNWRPFRTWVTVLLRTALEADTWEIRGR